MITLVSKFAPSFEYSRNSSTEIVGKLPSVSGAMSLILTVSIWWTKFLPTESILLTIFPPFTILVFSSAERLSATILMLPISIDAS